MHKSLLFIVALHLPAVIWPLMLWRRSWLKCKFNVTHSSVWWIIIVCIFLSILFCVYIIHDEQHWKIWIFCKERRPANHHWNKISIWNRYISSTEMLYKKSYTYTTVPRNKSRGFSEFRGNAKNKENVIGILSKYKDISEEKDICKSEDNSCWIFLQPCWLTQRSFLHITFMKTITVCSVPKLTLKCDKYAYLWQHIFSQNT